MAPRGELRRLMARQDRCSHRSCAERNRPDHRL